MKKSLFPLLCLLLAFSLSIVVFAHPGGTDGNGGHTDRDTGEYHYHHGYPAHDHYDMDGDGVVDCPYDFDDQTGQNSGSGGNSFKNSSSDYNIYKNENVDSRPPTTAPTNTKEEVHTVPVWIYFIIPILFIYTIFLIRANKRKDEKISQLNISLADVQRQNNKIIDEQYKETNQRYCATPFVKEINILEAKVASLQKQLEDAKKNLDQEKRRTENLKSENSQLQSRIVELSDALDEKESIHSKQTPLSSPIPDDIYFINGNVPVKGIISERRPFGDYTVYVAKRGKCYHADQFCGSGFLDAVHLFDVVNKKPPCNKCVYSKTVDIPEWYDQLDFFTPNSK